MRKFLVEEPIYNTKLTVCQCKRQEFVDFIKKEFGKEIKLFGAGKFVAIVNNKTNEENMFVWYEELEDRVLLHECLHCAVYVMTERGININKENDEPFCYYATWLFCSVKEAICKKS